MDAHALSEHFGLRVGASGGTVESPVFKRFLVSDGPVDIATVSGAGGHGYIENFGDALGCDFDCPLLCERELVRLAVDGVEALPLAVDGALLNAGLLECADDGVGGLRSGGVGGLRIRGLATSGSTVISF